MPNIAIVWDFDKTLTQEDSTSKVIDIILGAGSEKNFWNFIKDITGKKEKPEWEQLLGSDAPAWMYALSRIAFEKRIPLNSEFFGKFVKPHINLFPDAIKFLEKLKNIEKRADFKKLNLRIHHFVVSAGLQHLVEQVLPSKLITHVFGCRYTIIAFEGHEDEPESIPVFCMDETMKTRALFEISKSSFIDHKKPVNKRVEKENRWAHFSDFIYIGDGPTDIPALSLTRYHGGLGIVVYDPRKSEKDIANRLKDMSLDKRADLITPADYSAKSELFQYIKNRCLHIKQRYEAEIFF